MEINARINLDDMDRIVWKGPDDGIAALPVEWLQNGYITEQYLIDLGIRKISYDWAMMWWRVGKFNAVQCWWLRLKCKMRQTKRCLYSIWFWSEP